MKKLPPSYLLRFVGIHYLAFEIEKGYSGLGQMGTWLSSGYHQRLSILRKRNKRVKQSHKAQNEQRKPIPTKKAEVSILAIIRF